MTQDRRAREQTERTWLGRSDRTTGHDRGTGAPPTPSAAGTADDARIAEALAQGLGRLRAARPGFQEELECRLLTRLAERPPRPWWRHWQPARPPARPAAPTPVRMSRRTLLGLAAGTALGLAAASLSLPFAEAPAVSAREILEKAQANAENPLLAGIKSFHLTAKIWTNGGPKPAAGGPREMSSEQWFVAPDRLRTETRTRDASGKMVVSGVMMSGSTLTSYGTDGAADVVMFGIFTAPITGSKITAVHAAESREVRGGPGSDRQAVAGTRVAPPAVQTEGTTAKADGGGPLAIGFETREEHGDGREVESEVIRLGDNCPEPRRTGEGSVARRPVFVVEQDFRGCLPAAASKLPGRHVRWVDQETYLPLKMEMYDRDGQLMDRYEVTAIEYDVEIPMRTFAELPPGTSARDPKVPRPALQRPGAAPSAKPASP